MAFTRVASVVDQQAAEWFARRLRPAGTADEEDAFQRWLAQDPAHESAYARTEKMWGRLGTAVQQPQILSMPEAVPPASAVASAAFRPRRSLAGVVALAASIALVFIGWHLVEGDLFPQSYQTAVGETRTVSLADGSVVTLDTNSRIDVRFTERQRDITLKQGTAFFDVTPNKSRPFVVTAALGRTTVLGTRFEIHSEPREMRVLLVDGSLRLDSLDVEGVRRSGSIVLKPGQLATRVVSEAEWTTSSGDVEATTAWHAGRLIMHDVPLARALEEVNRYTVSKLRIGDPALGALTVSGVFRIGDVNTFQLALENTLPVRAYASGTERVLVGVEPPKE
ncbi:MAG: FecR family protein [Gammaproteobacteria bacterium]